MQGYGLFYVLTQSQLLFVFIHHSFILIYNLKNLWTISYNRLIYFVQYHEIYALIKDVWILEKRKNYALKDFYSMPHLTRVDPFTWLFE